MSGGSAQRAGGAVEAGGIGSSGARAPAHRGAEAAMLGLTAIWGVAFVVVKGALDDSDPFTFLALRFGTAALAALLVFRRRVLDRRLVRPGAWLGLVLFLGFLTQTLGLETTTPSRSAFLTSLFVVFVPLASWALLGKRPGASAYAGAALAVVGTYVLSGASFGDGLSRGDWFTVACAAAYGVHIALTGHWSQGLPAGPLVGVEVVVVTVLAAAALPFAARHLTPTADFALAVALTGVVCTTFALSVQTWAQARTSELKVALIISTEPVFATAWSIFRGRESFDSAVLVGGGLILLGVVVSELFRKKV